MKARIVFLSMISLLLTTGNTFGQMPGRWHVVDSVRGWHPIDIQFCDALHGMVLADSIAGHLPDSIHRSSVIRTTDGGITWELVVADSIGLGDGYYHPAFERVSYHSFSMPTPMDAYELNSNGLYGHVFATHDGGSHWEDNSKPFVPGVSTAWFRMFPPGTGRAIDATRGSGIPVAKTADSGRVWSGVGYNDPIDNRIQDAIFLDTLNFWVSYSDGEVLHSTDGGLSFCTDTTIAACADTVLPILDSIHVIYSFYYGGNLVFDTVPAFQFSNISQTMDPRRFYILLSRTVQEDSVRFPFHSEFADDFVETKDGGVTWRVDSSLGSPRIYRLLSPARDKLWAFVGPTPLFYNPSSDLGYVRVPSDSLLYSPDDGASWFRDSVTFRGAKLIEMSWPDEAHGYITALRDSMLLIYRFVSNEDVSSSSSKPKLPLLRMIQSSHPEMLSFEEDNFSGPVFISIVDVLGRTQLETSGELTASAPFQLSIAGLPLGAYMLAVQSNEGISYARFVNYNH